MPQIYYTEGADADLRGIWSYIAEESAPAVADAMLARIFGTLEVLSFASHIGRVRNDFRGKPRSFAVRPYTIVYEPLPDDGGILVWRVLHGARNLKRIVKRPKGGT